MARAYSSTAPKSPVGGVFAQRGQRAELTLGEVGALLGGPLEIRVISQELARIQLQCGLEGGGGALLVARPGGVWRAVVLLEQLAVGGDAEGAIW